MKRNSQDDLLIARNLLIYYIDFLQNRAKQQIEILTNDFSSLQPLALPEKCRAYIHLHEQTHLDSTSEYLGVLLEMKKKISDFFEIYQRPLPLYSNEMYHQNLQTHKAEVEKIFNFLFKN